MTKLPLCAQIGAIHGMVAGFAFGLAVPGLDAAAATTAETTWVILLVSAVALLVSLFILVVLRKYAFGSVLLPTFLNAILVTVVVAVVLLLIGPHPAIVLLGLVLGFVLGILVGWLLCLLCRDRRLGFAVDWR